MSANIQRRSDRLSGQLYGLHLMLIIVPAVLLLVFGYWPWYYSRVDVDVLRLFGVTLLLVAPLILDQMMPTPRTHIRVPLAPVFSNTFLLAMIAISAVSIASGNSGWRYSGESISEMGGIWLYFFMIMPTVGKLLALEILYFRQTCATAKSTTILLALLLFMTINGNMTAIFALCVSVLLFTSASNLLFDQGRRKGRVVRAIVYLVAILAGWVLLVVAYIYGESVKRGISPVEVYNWITTNFFDEADWFKELVLGRVSPTLVSNLHVAQEDWCRSGPCKSFDFLSVLNTGLFRVSNVFGLGDVANVTKDLNGTISRINYNEISIDPFNDREGTSPGLLPGFFYAFGTYLIAPMFLLYATMLVLLLKRVASLVKRKLSFVGKLFLLYLLLPIFESPLDVFMIVDDSLIYLTGLVVLCWWRVWAEPKVTASEIRKPLTTA